MKVLSIIIFLLLLPWHLAHPAMTKFSVLVRNPNSTPIQFTCEIDDEILNIVVQRYIFVNSPDDCKIDLEWRIALTLTTRPYTKFAELLREAPVEIGSGGFDVTRYEISLIENGSRKNLSFSACDNTSQIPVMKEMLRIVDQLFEIAQIKPRKFFESQLPGNR